MVNLPKREMKKLIEFWVKRKKDVRLLDVAKNYINDSILNLKAYVPSEFSRLPRLLDDFYFWKATELRCFSVYKLNPVNCLDKT